MKNKDKAKRVRVAAVDGRDSFNVDEFTAKINAKFGVGSIFRASEGVGLKVQYLRTGCHRLDFALGGGWPKGRMIELFGQEHSGKSTMLYSAIAQFQKDHPKGLAAVVDFERSFDANYVSNLGVDLDRLFVINPDDGEQGADMLNDVLLAQTDILVGVDSIAAMTPISTLDVSAEKAEVGVHPRLINRAMAKCNARMKRNLIDPDFPTTTVIWINQLREKVGVMFGNPETTPGGKAKNFFTSVRVRLGSSAASDNKIEVKKNIGGVERDVLVGRVFKFSIAKNKCGGTPFEDGAFSYFIKPYKCYPAWSFDNEDALFEYGRFHGVIKVRQESKGGVTFSYKDISTKMPHLFVQALKEDEEVANELYEEIMTAVKKFNSGEDEQVADSEEEEVPRRKNTKPTVDDDDDDDDVSEVEEVA